MHVWQGARPVLPIFTQGLCSPFSSFRVSPRVHPSHSHAHTYAQAHTYAHAHAQTQTQTQTNIRYEADNDPHIDAVVGLPRSEAASIVATLGALDRVCICM
jgi:ABC-type nickel/cobalt efflux system permease component RcnA